ncbi:MAG: ABC transporter substrate-binding protein [bacterium]
MKKLSILLLSLVLLGLTNMSFPATLKIGMQDEPKHLNPFKASDVWSWNVIGFLYEGLYTHNPQTFEIIPWLATGDPEYNNKDNTCIVHLKKGVKWEDGEPFTANDVVFSANVLMDFKVPQYYSAWDFITKVEALDKYTVKFWLKEPYAIFFTRTLMSLIVPEHIWQPIIKEMKRTNDPLNSLLEYEVTKPIGMGAFKFAEWNKGSYVKMVKNPLYFATGRNVKGKKVGPYFDEILFKIYGTTDTAILSLKKGDIDYIWWPVQPGFVAELKQDKKITVTNNPENGLKYLAFNLRRMPFKDINFRHAVAYLIDKEFIQTRVLQNYGIPNDSILPPGNKFWFNPNTHKYGRNMSRAERVKKAVEILKKAGYSWEKEPEVNSKGKIISGKGLIMPDGKPVNPIKILTPPADYDPLRAMCGMFIQEWLKQIGIPASAAPTSFGDIINKVMTEWDFDVFILGYRLSLDPDFMRTFFHSKEVVKDGDNPMAYINPEFDKLSDASAKEMVRAERKKLILKLQDFIIKEAPWIPLYTMLQIEAYRNDRFTGWVNQLDGIGNGWSFLFIKPVK